LTISYFQAVVKPMGYFCIILNILNNNYFQLMNCN